MNKSQTVRADSVVRQLAALHPEFSVSVNPNLVTNSLGQKIATFIFAPADGSRELFVTENVGNTIKTMLWNIEDSLSMERRMAERKK